MTAEDLKLPPKMKQLYELLLDRGDVSIEEIVTALRGSKPGEGPTYSQQWLGSYVTSLNRRLKNHGLRVVPGRMKRTYALVSL